MKDTHPVVIDPDLQKVGQALERAAEKARELGFQTGTPVYVFREGKIVDLTQQLLDRPRLRKPSKR